MRCLDAVLAAVMVVFGMIAMVLQSSVCCAEGGCSNPRHKLRERR